VSSATATPTYTPYELAQAARMRWLRTARPGQITPAGEWRVWLAMAGRGWGKTRVGAEDVADFARRHPGGRTAVVARTFSDGRDVCVEGESGLLSVIPWSFVKSWNRSMGELDLVNRHHIKLYSAEKPNSLRGPQHHRAWCDEFATWERFETFDMLMLGLRLGLHPQAVVTTTPKAKPAVRALLHRRDVVVTRGTTWENADNLSAAALAEFEESYGGSALGRQELEGEFVEDDSDLVIPYQWAQECAGLTAAALPCELGVDVGAGGDESVIALRRGPHASIIHRDRNPDTMRTTGQVVRAIRETGARRVKVDEIGIGRGVCDRLKELRPEHGAEVVGVNVGAGSRQPSRFPKLRDELWWEVGRKLSESRGWDLSALGVEGLDQLTAPEWAPDSSGRVKVESKDVTRARLGRSPDIADAVLLAFYAPPTSTITVGRYR
jgi:hypothetical protein